MILNQDSKRKSDFEMGFINGAWMAGASGTQTAQFANNSITAVTKVASAFRFMEKILGHRAMVRNTHSKKVMIVH